MTKLYFGDTTTIATTIMILGLVVFIGYTIVNRGSVQHWGMRGAAAPCVRPCRLLFRDGSRRVGQDHSVLHRWELRGWVVPVGQFHNAHIAPSGRELRGWVVPVGQYPNRCRVHWCPCHNRVCNRHAHRELATG